MDLRSLGMGIAFALMWSSAFATARIIVAHAPPLSALALRFAISGVLAIGLARLLGQSWQLPRNQWRGVILFGLCQNAAYLGLNFVALQHTPAALASIIASTMPLIVALAGWSFRGERMAPLGLAGLALGFAGVIVIMSSRIAGGANASGIALCICGALALALATITLRSASGAGGNHLMIVGLQMLVGAAALAVVALASESPRLVPSASFFAAFAYQILVPGLAATLIWFALVARIGATRASTFHFLNPIFGTAVAALLLGERIGWTDLFGTLLTGAGILAVQISQGRRQGPPPSKA